MLKESFGRSTTENHSGRDKQVPAVKDCRFTQTAFGTVVHDSNMSVITDNLIDAFIKVAQVQAAGGIIVTVDDGRLAMQLRGF